MAPNYFSCARCGWRGILGVNEAHECNGEKLVGNKRAVQSTISAANGSGADSVKTAARDENDPTEWPGEPQAARLQRDISTMLDRYVGITYLIRAHDGIGTFDVHQRCDACREVFTTENVRGDRGYFATGVIVARAVRLAWLKHRCKPIGGELANLESADLRELYEQLEVESLRLAERGIAVKAVLDARLAEERP